MTAPLPQNTGPAGHKARMGVSLLNYRPEAGDPSSVPGRAFHGEKLRVLDLFAGIGGFSLGLERTGGFETVAFCEIEPFPRKVLTKHWPKVPQYEDVRELTGDRLAADGITVDVITGGFPCQDISTAGKQSGISDGTRSGLWSEIARLVGEIRPRYVIVENVAALLSGPSERRGGWFGRVLGDLATLRYDAEWHCIPATYVGAPHRRDRVWLVAYPQSIISNGGSNDSGQDQTAPCEGTVGKCSRALADAASQQNRWVQQPRVQPDFATGRHRNDAHTDSEGLQEREGKDPKGAWPIIRPVAPGVRGWIPEPNVGRVANGVPYRAQRLKALGNAVVPQIPELLGRCILEAEAGQ